MEMDMATTYTSRQFLNDANAILPRTQSDPDPVTSVNYALTRLRHMGVEGEALRQRALAGGL